MPELYLDQDALAIAEPLRAAGYVVTTAHQLGFDAYDDEEHFLYAVQTQKTLITYNIQDFRMLHRAWLRWGMQPDHAGILIAAQSAGRDATARAIISLLH